MRDYLEREKWWLDDYAVFRALHNEQEGRHWIEWPAPLRDREAGALAEARSRLADDIRYYSWLQWVAGTQWAQARADCGDVAILGDFPFMVSGDSADVWARQDQFRIDASVGVPPDAFSETGQDWGLPVYRWDVIAATGYEWLKMRVRRSAALFDGFRIDHLVGFYRTFVREKGGHDVLRAGEREGAVAAGGATVSIFRDSGALRHRRGPRRRPRFRAAFTGRPRGARSEGVAMGAGLERRRGVPSAIPPAYPPLSVAISGTHDTETLAEWWDSAEAEERCRAIELPALVEGGILADETYSPRLRDALLAVLFGAGSDLVLLPRAGHLRLDRADQRPGRRRGAELVVAAAMAGRLHAEPSRRRENAPTSWTGSYRR